MKSPKNAARNLTDDLADGHYTSMTIEVAIVGGTIHTDCV